MRKQGIIDYSEPILPDREPYLGETTDGSTIFSGEFDTTIDKDFVGIDYYTVSYHGLVNQFDGQHILPSSILYPHITISTEELNSGVSDNIACGSYLLNREHPDSLLRVLKKSSYEHSVGYAVLSNYTKLDDTIEPEIENKYNLTVVRSLGESTLRTAVVSFLEKEISRERSQFIASGEIDVDYLEMILGSESVCTAVAVDDNQINSVIVFADSPSVLPWFNEERIDELANRMGLEYSDVKLAFLAFTNPENREKKVASALFDLLMHEVSDGKEDIIICTECSPRSISYVPFMITKHLSSYWDRKETISERTKATIIYPNKIS